jgi:hypothetical protein
MLNFNYKKHLLNKTCDYLVQPKGELYMAF